MSFQALEVADLDGDGTGEIVAGSRLEHSGGAGYFVHVFDFATRREVRRSAAPATGFGAFTGIRVIDSDGDGDLEILGLAGSRGLRIYDGETLAQEAMIAGTFRHLALRERPPSPSPSTRARPTGRSSGPARSSRPARSRS